MNKHMRLIAFLIAGPTMHHNGAWRHPEADNGFLSPEWYEHIARVLEGGKFDGLFLADVQALYGSPKGDNEYTDLLAKGGQMCLLDPLPLMAIMSRVTRNIGLGVTISTSLSNPYQIARTMGTLNLISNGRMAWNVVTSASNLEARNFGAAGLPPREERYDRADEVLEAVTALWQSWPTDAIMADKATGIFADPAKVRPVNYNGKWIRSAGPLTVPRSPHGDPVIMQAGASDRGREFAARWAEVVFTLQHSKSHMQEFYADLKGRMTANGRAPEECAIMVSVDPIIGETESIAREKQAFINDFVDAELGLVLISNHTGIDFSQYPLDQPVADMVIEGGSRGSFDVILQGTKSENLTLGEAAKRFAISELCPQIVGTPESVADQLQDLFESGCCDGFIVTSTQFPGTFESFARSVVPILQQRGVFRNEYTGRNLRENLRAQA